MKIAVIGLYYASNLGDAVICDCVAAWLEKAYPAAQIEVIDIEGNKDLPVQETISALTRERRKWNLRRDQWLTKSGISDRIYYWSAAAIASRLSFYDEVGRRGYDAAVFAGGQLFMDWLSLGVCELLKRFEKARVPVFFNACGVGSSFSKQIRECLARQLNSENIKLVSTRDDADTMEKRYFCGRKCVTPTYDPALWTKETYGQEHKECSVVGLGVMYSDHAGQHRITNFWLDVIRNLDLRNIEWKMFCNGSLEDYEYGCHVLKKAGRNPEGSILKCAASPRELTAQIAGFRSIISFRLHSHIIAASLGIPGIAVVWDDKLRFFYSRLGHPERCATIEVSGKQIMSMLERAEAEGVNSEMIEKQKKYAKTILLDSINQVIGYEQR